VPRPHGGLCHGPEGLTAREEAFSPACPEPFAEIARETDVLSQELSGSGELVGAYGVVGQVNAQVVRAADGVPSGNGCSRAEAREYPDAIPNPGFGAPRCPDPGSPPYVRHITRRSGRPGSSSASSRRRR
jgi:hypothetical protein